MQDDDPILSEGSAGERFDAVVARRWSRRGLLSDALGFAALSSLGLTGCNGGSNSSAVVTPLTPTVAVPGPKLGFASVPISTIDNVIVPNGYSARVIHRWGDPISDGPVFKLDASNSSAEQALQFGMHHDGMAYFPLPIGSAASNSGLLVTNHEYVEANIFHGDGGYSSNPGAYTPEKFRKEIAAHGVSIAEVAQRDGQWSTVRGSRYARRITAATPITLSGPAAGDEALCTAADPIGREVLGTFNNCAHGQTPWGSYLTCEENFASYFDIGAGASGLDTATLTRYGVATTGAMGYGWSTQDPRFDIARHPNEVNRHGWVVEIDPYDAASKPVKRTALGRFAHESAAVVVSNPGKRAVVYSGDDSRYEYVYKFISANSVVNGNREANRNILDNGTLCVARFNADGSGEWLALVFGEGVLTLANGFRNQADVLIRARVAADRLGATKMDRPEWIAINPRTHQVYLTLTNNTRRTAAELVPPNPRASNVFGHIVTWVEAGGDAAALRFNWSIFALAGDPSLADPNLKGNIVGDIYACPDGLWMDPREVLWIQTDVSDADQRAGNFTGFGNCMMLAADPVTGETRRFLTGPIGSEITGIAMTPDMKTLFVNVQHPGDVPKDLANAGVRLSAANPRAASNWPDFDANGRPRSATVVITRNDGGVVGA